MAMGLHTSRTRGRNSRRAPMAEINVTPLVDVMLVLLIIFMVTAPLLASGVPLELPDSRADPIDQEPDQITVAIDREGYIYIDDVLVEQGNLGVALESVAKGGNGQPPLVALRADRENNWGRVMAVMGELNRAGFSSISVVSNSSSEAP